MANIQHLSYSSVNLYLACGHAWWHRYVKKTPAPTSPSLVFGSAWHGTIEEWVRGTNEDPERVWQRNWHAQMERNQDIAWGKEMPATFSDTGLRMLASRSVRELIGSIRPLRDAAGLFLERRIELRVPKVSVPIIGYIDVMTEDGVPGDFKTAARMWSDDKAAGELQSLYYLAALNQAGLHEHGWRFRHYVFSKTQRPDARVFETRYAPGDVIWLFDVIRKAWEGMQAGVFPMNPSTWLCNPKWCEHWPGCRGRYTQ